MKSKIAQWFDQRNLRTEINGWLSKSTVIINGEHVAISTGGSLEKQEGIVRKQEALGHPAIQFGDLSRGYQELSVLKTFDYEGSKLVAIRAYSRELPAQTLFLDASTGLITASHSLQFLPGAGFVGMETQYRDYRDVAGMKLPFLIESKFATPMIGKVIVQYAQAEVGVASDDLFQLPE
jgi:hypothetical protein